MSSSSSSSYRRYNQDVSNKTHCDCKPPHPIPIQTAWTTDNPGRRFRGCPIRDKSKKCGVYGFLDLELPSDYYKGLVYSLHEENKALKRMNRMPVGVMDGTSGVVSNNSFAFPVYKWLFFHLVSYGIKKIEKSPTIPVAVLGLCNTLKVVEIEKKLRKSLLLEVLEVVVAGCDSISPYKSALKTLQYVGFKGPSHLSASVLNIHNSLHKYSLMGKAQVQHRWLSRDPTYMDSRWGAFGRVRGTTGALVYYHSRGAVDTAAKQPGITDIDGVKGGGESAVVVLVGVARGGKYFELGLGEVWWMVCLWVVLVVLLCWVGGVLREMKEVVFWGLRLLKIEVEPPEDPDSEERKFKRIYICLGHLKDGFKAGEGISMLHLKERIHGSGRAKSNILLNNLCEVQIIQLLDGRDKPIITCLEYIREYLMKRIVNVRKVEWNGSDLYQVTCPWGDQFVVNLSERVCSSRKWELSGIPCTHAVASIWDQANNGIDTGIPESYCLPVHWLLISTLIPIHPYQFWVAGSTLKAFSNPWDNIRHWPFRCKTSVMDPPLTQVLQRSLKLLLRAAAKLKGCEWNGSDLSQLLPYGYQANNGIVLEYQSSYCLPVSLSVTCNRVVESSVWSISRGCKSKKGGGSQQAGVAGHGDAAHGSQQAGVHGSQTTQSTPQAS
ncbi:photosystem I assembly protein Ycf4, chloroplast [Tanacetum coccineum]